MLNEDFAPFFDDFAVVATYGAEQARVIFDAPDQVIVGDDVITAEYQITYPAGQLSGLKYNDSISVSGVAYRVNNVQAIDDGKLFVARLSKV